MSSLKLAGVGLLLCALLASCCVVGRSQRSGPDFNLLARRVTIITEPPGATVYQTTPFKAPSERLGETPLHDRTVAIMTDFRGSKIPLSLTKRLVEYDGNLGVMIKKDGYKTYSGILRTEAGTVVEHRIPLEPET